MTVLANAQQIRLERLSPAYWRVTIHHPPLNIFGPEMIPRLEEIVAAVGFDTGVKVIVFDCEVKEFFLTHYDFLAKLDDPTSLAPGSTGLEALPDMLACSSRAPVVSIESTPQEPDAVSFGPFCLHDNARLLEREGVPVKLGSRAMDILRLLVKRAGEVIRKDELMAHAWPGLVVDETSLRVHIAKLRKALGDGKAGARYVTNVPSRGYCFVALVQRNVRTSSPGVPDKTAPDSLPHRLERMIGQENVLEELPGRLAVSDSSR